MMLAGMRSLRWVGGLFWVVPTLAQAVTFTAMVQWQPSTSPGVVGYHVYARTLTGTYGAPINAGMPTLAGDGTMSSDVGGLDAAVGHAFTVTAYASDGTESALSNELTLPVQLTTTTTSSTTSTTRPPTTTSTSSSTSTTHTTSSTSTTRSTTSTTTSTSPTTTVALGCTTASQCDDGNSCTVDSCDPATGCTHVALQDGAPCDDGDPCATGRLCVTGVCQVPGAALTGADVVGDSAVEMAITKFSLTRHGRSGFRLVARASFQPRMPVEPDRSGMTIELDDASGSALFSASVPADMFEANYGRTRFLYISDRATTAPYAGLRILKVMTGGRSVIVIAKATVPASPLPSPELAGEPLRWKRTDSTLAWTLRWGTTCVSNPVKCHPRKKCPPR